MAIRKFIITLDIVQVNQSEVKVEAQNLTNFFFIGRPEFVKHILIPTLKEYFMRNYKEEITAEFIQTVLSFQGKPEEQQFNVLVETK